MSKNRYNNDVHQFNNLQYRGMAMKIKEIIVVEGKNDTNKIKQAVEADTIETGGLTLSKETIQLIKHAQQKRGVIIFTDPDFAGNHIRRKIAEAVPGCRHAYLPKKDALPNNIKESVGIEHASLDAIRLALKNVQVEQKPSSESITHDDLLRHGLIGASDAKRRRELLGDHLHIGYANAKQLLKRLNMFNISRDELNEAMLSILESGKEND